MRGRKTNKVRVTRINRALTANDGCVPCAAAALGETEDAVRYYLYRYDLLRRYDPHRHKGQPPLIDVAKFIADFERVGGNGAALARMYGVSRQRINFFAHRWIMGKENP